MSTAHITIGTSANGKACGAGDYEIGSLATLFATPDSGYSFTQWNDGVTLNPRTVKVTENATYTASFNGSTPASNVIRYNAATAVTGSWVTNNTDTSRNTYDSVTGNGVLYLNEGVTTIGGYYSTDYSPFYNKSDLVSVVLGSQITTIGNDAFYNCTGLTTITIPNSVTSIGSSAFFYCSGLTTIIIPNSVTTIGNSAFVNCSGLTTITIPSGITSISNGVFSGCTGLTTITIPNSVTSIGISAFYCSNLTYVTCLATTPPALGNSNFPASGDTLYVPAASVSAYQADASWSAAFTTITSI